MVKVGEIAVVFQCCECDEQTNICVGCDHRRNRTLIPSSLASAPQIRELTEKISSLFHKSVTCYKASRGQARICPLQQKSD